MHTRRFDLRLCCGRFGNRKRRRALAFGAPRSSHCIAERKADDGDDDDEDDRHGGEAMMGYRTMTPASWC